MQACLLGFIGPEQRMDIGNIDPLPGAREQAAVTDTVKAIREHIDQEATDEFAGCQRHHPLAVARFDGVIFPTESHGVGIGADEGANCSRVCKSMPSAINERRCSDGNNGE